MKFVKIKSITPAGAHPVFDLTMKEGEDPSFIANSFVVHNSESSYSSFLETVNGYRTHLTNMLFHKKIFPLVAICNRLFIDDKKAKDAERISDFLFNANNSGNLKLPALHWHKDLTSNKEDNIMDMLEKVEGHGVPIPLKMWMAAANIDKDQLLRDAQEDAAIRKALEQVKAPAAPQGDGNMEASITSAMSTTPLFHRKRIPILNRQFPETDFYVTGKTGKKEHVFSNPRGKQKDLDHRIAKIAAKAETDVNYRELLRRRNAEKNVEKVKGF